jgi:subtilisin family serine protease
MPPPDEGTWGGSMDPALWELYESGSPVEEVSIILRMAKGTVPPAGVRVVSSFGNEIYTGRIVRGDIVAMRQAPGVLSLKAGKPVTLPSPFEFPDGTDVADAIDEGDEGIDEAARDFPDPAAVGEDGRGVVVGLCDWGFDFTHANLRNADGTTRLLALWDQRGHGDPLAPAPFNYGRLLTRTAIDAALQQEDPCAALGYHPASGDPTNTGSHGTHVADILAGNRREPGSRVGLASGSDLVFVHLAAPNLSELENLGDSVGLLEGLDFIRRQAAGRPCVLHLSAGKTGGPHRGDTLVERAVDFMLAEPGIILVQSVGNYASAALHAHARVGPAQEYTLDWVTPDNDRTPNELEIWYSGADVLEVSLTAPGGQRFSTPLDSRIQLHEGLEVWGNLYHRRHEPNSGLNHVNVYLYTTAPSGRWRVTVRGKEVLDGRIHAWIERDASGRYQSRFPGAQASSRFTTNTICNCYRAIAVGAYDSSSRDRPPTRFSSRGPTADGRQKPEIAAPGFKVLAARSLPRRGWRGERRLVAKSGTSMAAPWVSGTVALMFAAAKRPLTVHEVRRALIGTVDPHPHPGPAGRTSTQLGYGYLNTAAAVAAARRIGLEKRGQGAPASAVANEHEPEALPEEAGRAPGWLEDAAEAALVAPSEVAEGVPESDPAECGCGRAASQPKEETVNSYRSDENAEDATTFDEFDAVEEEIDAPFMWEDVQEALEAIEEIS